jgi:hypothetical protein
VRSVARNQRALPLEFFNEKSPPHATILSYIARTAGIQNDFILGNLNHDNKLRLTENIFHFFKN